MEEVEEMAVRGESLIRTLEEWAPPSLAVEKDPIGLQVGDPEAEVNGVLVTLDVTEEVIDEALRLGANWIVSHHAVIYRPLRQLRGDRPAGRLAAKLLKNGINVYVTHTNLDTAVGGVNDVLAEKLGLENPDVLVPHVRERLKKIVVFIPEDHHMKVLNAMCEAGAGWIGDYSHCTFNLRGTGTFLPGEGTDPYIGQQGKLEQVEEVRLETIVPESIQSRVVEAMIQAHPYEEVAYDIYPLELSGPSFGLGRIGRLPEKMTLQTLAERVKEAYEIPALRLVGDPDRPVSTVAVLGGSGSRYAQQALERGADVSITGDIDYHTALDALASGLALIDPGHHVERLVLERVCQVLREKWAPPEIQVVPTSVHRDPFQFL
jgi:dinuclear metal center YbgI/SA1388 family protein